ncbi:MAG: hypothetical protein A4S09_08965 [Proteobacteria bacterium SG_bin7]|nr:MAG: hypothetical protein A4S09_08965 [Proteobacteria bacterium SG_bin7]
MKKIFLLAFILVGNLAFTATVEFHIPYNTGKGPWNTKETSAYVKVGDTLRIYNDDIIPHQLHTFGAPCGHGPSFPGGNVWECEITQEYSSKTSGPLYDHLVGERAEFWIESTN